VEPVKFRKFKSPEKYLHLKNFVHLKTIPKLQLADSS